MNNPFSARDFKDKKQLFLDDWFIADRRGVELVVNNPIDRGQILKADKPWENGGVLSWGDLLVDPVAGNVKFYYLSQVNGEIKDQPDEWRLMQCLVVSEDGGKTWEKPDLGVCEFNGSKDNNIVMAGGHRGCPRYSFHENGKVVIDPNDKPEMRYKMLYMGRPEGIFGAYSADGIGWTVANEGNPISKAVSDSQNVVFWDDSINKWVGYFIRLWAPTRCVCRVETDDFWNWPFLEPEKVVLAPDELDEIDGKTLGAFYLKSSTDGGRQKYNEALSPENWVWFTDEINDLAGVDFYNEPAVKYPWADNAYVMPFTPLLHRRNMEEIHLAVSRDGKEWSRPGDRQPWLRPAIGHNNGIYYASPGILRDGNEIHHYYYTSIRWHGGGRYENGTISHQTPEIPEYSGEYRRLALRMDGYMSADAGSNGGEIVTRPFVFQGSRLELNVDTAASGQLEVGLTPFKRNPAPGQSAATPETTNWDTATCDKIVANDLAHTVTWNQNPDVSALAGRAVRMHVRMKNTKLYAFQFTS